MDQVYALGVTVIEFLQEWLQDYEGYFEFINDISNPNHALEILFPLLSAVDSVFASQLVLCTAFGGWFNAVAKWWLLEDRPYWWVRETSFYEGHRRPVLRQTRQTCETGPGCPSGHSSNAAMLLVLTVYWISHVLTDRKLHYGRWWKYAWYPFCAMFLLSVMLSRMYVATHFPHQVLAGTLLGGFLAPFLCIYVADPFIWQYGPHVALSVPRAVFWHALSAVVTVLIGVVTYFSMTWCGFDPQWTVQLAFRWCENVHYIHVNTTPMYAIVYCTGHLLGWALSVTPEVAKYRHYTTSRSIITAVVLSACLAYFFHNIDGFIDKGTALFFYSCLFGVSVIKVPVFLRLVPYLSTLSMNKEKGSNVKQKHEKKKIK